jgi:hypothetical protein
MRNAVVTADGVRNLERLVDGVVVDGDHWRTNLTAAFAPPEA